MPGLGWLAYANHPGGKNSKKNGLAREIERGRWYFRNTEDEGLEPPWACARRISRAKRVLPKHPATARVWSDAGENSRAFDATSRPEPDPDASSVTQAVTHRRHPTVRLAHPTRLA